ncbi:MAG: OmpW family outer membrane protein [Betaproteobacteria bacterium]|jgi:outer membrane protein
MMIKRFTIAAASLCCAVLAHAQDYGLKVGLTRYTSHSATTGIQGIGAPPGADASVGDASTVIFAVERRLNPNFGFEMVVGVPPKISARATGSVAFLGDKVLTARNLAPTLMLNYSFGDAGATWRPYVGIGANFTRFSDIQSSLAPKVEMSDSFGLALQAGVNYSLSKQWGLFGSISAIDVSSKLVATGNTVLTTTIDFRPIVYTLGTSYRF